MYGDSFETCLEQYELIDPVSCAPGSVSDAALFFHCEFDIAKVLVVWYVHLRSIFAVDLPLWMDTDGALEWVQEFVRERGLRPKEIEPQLVTAKGNSIGEDDAAATAEDSEEEQQLSPEETENMFAEMFNTAIAMALENENESVSKKQKSQKKR